MNVSTFSRKRWRCGLGLLWALIGLMSASGQAFAQIVFDQATYHPVGIRPMGLVAGDFDANGTVDVAKVSEFREAVLVGCGDGNFFCGGGAGYNSVEGTRAIVAGDLDNDGFPDTIAITTNINEVHVVLSSLPEPNRHGYYFAYAPIGSALVDINYDGWLDIISVSESGEISTLINRQDGTFDPAYNTIEQVISGARAIAAGMLDSETPGVAIANADGFVYIYVPTLVEGTVEWNLRNSQQSGANPSAIQMMDFDFDNLADIVTTNRDGNNMSFLKGLGGGGMAFPVTYSVGTEPVSLAVGDLNNDGLLDIVTGNAGSNDISILMNIGDNTFSPSFPISGAWPVRAVALGDFNNDSLLDLVMAADDGYEANVYLGDGLGGFNLFSRPVFAFSNAFPMVGDLDSDGDLDVVTVSGNSVATVSKNRGFGDFDAPVFYPLTSLPAGDWRCAALMDVDKDNDLDIVTVGFPRALRVLLNDGFGNFTERREFSTVNDATRMILLDADGDGNLDVIACDRNGGPVEVILGDGAGNFTTSVITPGPTSPTDIAAGDFDGDGIPDLALTNIDQNTVTILRGTRVGTLFALVGQIAVGSLPRSLAVQDVNADGNLDIVTANIGSQDVTVLRGQGNGTFLPAIAYSVGSAPFGILVADVDFDSVPDLVLTTDIGGGSVTVLRGTGGGAFANGVAFPTEFNPAMLAYGDINGDSAPDVVVGYSSLEAFSVLRNLSTAAVSVSGTLIFDGLNSAGPSQFVTFIFRPQEGGGEFERPMIVGADGSFTLFGIPRNVYTLHIRAQRYLARNVSLDTTNGDVTNVSALMRPGDLIEDGLIDLFDLVEFFGSYGTSAGDPSWNDGIADITGDGIVDLFDLILFFSHYGEAGDL
jgi:hypothetical protein